MHSPATGQLSCARKATACDDNSAGRCSFENCSSGDSACKVAATMRVKVASALTIVDAKGTEMDEAETVTLFNDLCVFAPGALIDRRIQWQEVGQTPPARSLPT